MLIIRAGKCVGTKAFFGLQLPIPRHVTSIVKLQVGVHAWSDN